MVLMNHHHRHIFDRVRLEFVSKSPIRRHERAPELIPNEGNKGYIQIDLTFSGHMFGFSYAIGRRRKWVE